MRSTAPEAFRDGHSRLYEHYSKQAPHQPDTLEEMTPLFSAVYHGCQAGLYQVALDDVYRGRIRRSGEAYLIHKLGAFGTNLSLIANFFESPWTRPVAELSEGDQSWLTSSAAFALRALGRLTDAVEPMRAGAEGRVQQEKWKNAAVNYSNLSELHVALGNISEAVVAARKSVDFADRSGDSFRRIAERTTLADAFNHSGALADSARLFQEAERLQAEWQPDYPILYSVQGYQYCDLLLTQGQSTEVIRRASQALQGSQRQRFLLDIGLDHLSLGRAHPLGSAESITHLDQAVDYLRRAGVLEYLPLALLARGTPHDLEEVYTIASRSGMRLHLADYHLAMARLHHSREHFEKAHALVQETGYHRRDPELAELRRTLYPEESQ